MKKNLPIPENCVTTWRIHSFNVITGVGVILHSNEIWWVRSVYIYIVYIYRERDRLIGAGLLTSEGIV